MQNAQAAHEARMRRLAEQPRTEVLKYDFSLPERDATASVCVGLARRVVEARQKVAHLSVKAARQHICAEDAVLDQFSRTHPRIFKTMLNVDTCGFALEMLEKLARLRQQIESREMSEAEGNVHASRLIMERTMQNPDPDQTRGTSGADTLPESVADE